ncbi:MAG: hypothetical protein NTX97_12065, partial [Bacteroidetes bacterium]|nr:hypothetical protein [Bacteroidota bacterium]
MKNKLLQNLFFTVLLFIGFSLTPLFAEHIHPSMKIKIQKKEVSILKLFNIELYKMGLTRQQIFSYKIKKNQKKLFDCIINIR